MWSNLHPGMSVSRSEAARLASECPDGGVVLELGCHKGWGTENILAALDGRGTVIGVECDPEFARQARARCPEATIVVADSNSYVPERVDVVVVDDDIKDRILRADKFKALFPGAAVFVHDYYGPGHGMVRV